MSEPTSGGGMDGTICKICERPIKKHTPEEFVECQKKQNSEGWGT